MQFSISDRQGASAEINVLRQQGDRSLSTVMRAVTVAGSSFSTEQFDLSVTSAIKDCDSGCGNTLILGIAVLVLLELVGCSLMSSIRPPVIV